ncbi:hypothetical protein [Myxococcus phage Mx1]|nr:hypothetical protein [Myxococcus phage Mx1]
MIKGFNKNVACKVPENKGVETTVNKGLATVKHRHSLIALEVLYGTSDVPAGTTVYVSSSSSMNQRWFTEAYELDGEKFILVPEAAILLVGLDPSPLVKKLEQLRNSQLHDLMMKNPEYRAEVEKMYIPSTNPYLVEAQRLWTEAERLNKEPESK